MNCAAPSLAAFVVGCVVGGALTLLMVHVIANEAWKIFEKDEMKRLRRLSDAALKLYSSDVEGVIFDENAPEDASAQAYQVPAETWEQFESEIEASAFVAEIS